MTFNWETEYVLDSEVSLYITFGVTVVELEICAYR